MADSPIAKLSIDVVANLKINKSELQKAADEIKSGLETGTSKAAGGFGTATKSVINFTSVLKGAKSGLSVIKDGFDAVKKKAQDTIKPINGFLSAIKRIAVYRAIRWALKEITQGFQEGIQNAYQWAMVTGNQFAKSMDMMATSALYLKNSLGAMTMPLVNTLAPILDALVDKFVDLINVVNQFIATITGATTWTRALKYPKQYADAIGGATREIKNQLLGFDELNILKAPSAGGGASALDYSSMFKNMKLSESALSFSKAIKDAIKKGDWSGIGKLFGEKFNNMLASADAAGFAKALGEKINNGISLVHSFLEEANFFEVGVKIGEFFSNLKLDWQKIGASWVKWSLNVKSAILGMLSSIDWGNVGHALGEFIKGLFNGFSSWIRQIDWNKLASNVTRALFDFIASIDWNGLLRSIYTAIAGVLSTVWSWLSSSFRTLIKLFTGETSASQISNAVNQSYYSGVGSGGGTTVLDGRLTYASGGFPQQGTMFIAGEQNGNPEFVGNIGGRTGVMNADQMAQALASANAGVVEAVTAMANAVVQAINRKDTSINVNDVRIALKNSNMRYGV